MHSHDRTLLSKLGFSDPDKHNPLHDAACAYLAEPEQAARLAKMGSVPMPSASIKNNGPYFSQCTIEKAEANPDSSSLWLPQEWHAVDIQVELEHPITKGLGQYSTTIGFVDLLIEFSSKVRVSGWLWENGTKIYGDNHWDTVRNRLVITEVKIGEVPVGDVLRQLKMYHGYIPVRETYCGTWSVNPTLILATTYPINTVDAAVLARENITHVRLGAGFEAWCNTKREVHASPEL